MFYVYLYIASFQTHYMYIDRQIDKEKRQIVNPIFVLKRETIFLTCGKFIVLIFSPLWPWSNFKKNLLNILHYIGNWIRVKDDFFSFRRLMDSLKNFVLFYLAYIIHRAFDIYFKLIRSMSLYWDMKCIAIQLKNNILKIKIEMFWNKIDIFWNWFF